MKRDLEIIRNILMALEEENPIDVICDEDVLNHHLRLMIEAGLIRGDAQTTSEGLSVYVQDEPITNSGYDLLDSIRQDKIWKKVVKGLIPLGGSVSIELLKQYAVSEGAKLLGIGGDGS